MMKPIPLDDVFKDGVQPVRDMRHRLFDNAMDAAKQAYEETAVFLKDNPGVMGGSAAQSARVAFLKVLTGE